MRSILSSSFLFLFSLAQAQFVLPKQHLLRDSGIHHIHVNHLSLGIFNEMSGDTIDLGSKGKISTAYTLLLDDSARMIELVSYDRGKVYISQNFTYDAKGRLVKSRSQRYDKEPDSNYISFNSDGSYEYFSLSSGRIREHALYNPDGIYLRHVYYTDHGDSVVDIQNPSEHSRIHIIYNKGKAVIKEEWIWKTKDGVPYEYVERYHQLVKDRVRKMGVTEDKFKVLKDGSLKLYGEFKDGYIYKRKNFKTWAKKGPELYDGSPKMYLDEFKYESPIQSRLISFDGVAEQYLIQYVFEK